MNNAVSYESTDSFAIPKELCIVKSVSEDWRYDLYGNLRDLQVHKIDYIINNL